MGMRELSKKESEKIDMWLKADISEELIRKAYDITVDKTGKASFVYASKIIENWISAGYKTLADVENSEANHKNAIEKSSFDVDDFFKAALERSEKIYGKEVKK
jgi:DnaD/phage-associated family protein